MRKVAVGVDLGGTNVRAQAIDREGAPAGPRFERPSRAAEGTQAVVEALVEVVEQASREAEGPIVAVGIAIPGFVDDEAGLVRWAPNFGETVGGVFRHWVDVPIRAMLASRLALPLFLGNDANLAALGEYVVGAGEGTANCLVMLTLGTGVGSGVVLGPRAVAGRTQGPLLLLGGNGGGVELGHTIIQHGGLDCHAGTYGAVEAYCQRDAIVRRAVHKLQRWGSPVLEQLTGGDWSLITPRLLGEAAQRGDHLALEVWREVGEYLGVAIGNCINTFAPDVVAIGGQIAKVGDLLLEPARDSARRVAIPALYRDARVIPARCGDDAGLFGAALFAHSREASG